MLLGPSSKLHVHSLLLKQRKCASVKRQTSWRPNITNTTSLPHQHHTTIRTISIPSHHLNYHQQQHGHNHYHRHWRHHHHISIIPPTSISISTTITPPAPVPSARAPSPAPPEAATSPPPAPVPPTQPSPNHHTILTNSTTVTDITITASVLPSTTTKSPCKSPQTLSTD